MSFMTVGAGLGLLALGWLAGMLTFKVKSHWCRSCGTTLSCSACTAAVLPPGGYRRLA
jgi:hypothetical protein